MTEGPEVEPWRPVVALAELEEGRGRCVVVDGREVALFLTGGRVHAVDQSCPHAGGPIAEGDLDDEGGVWCPWHGWRFELESGACAWAQDRPLAVHGVRVVDGIVEVALRRDG